MLKYWYKGEEREVTEEIANAAMDEFEERFLDDEDRKAWEDAREAGFDEANEFSGSQYNVNLEQFFPKNWTVEHKTF